MAHKSEQTEQGLSELDAIARMLGVDLEDATQKAEVVDTIFAELWLWPGETSSSSSSGSNTRSVST